MSTRDEQRRKDLVGRCTDLLSVMHVENGARLRGYVVSLLPDSFANDVHNDLLQDAYLRVLRYIETSVDGYLARGGKSSEEKTESPEKAIYGIIALLDPDAAHQGDAEQNEASDYLLALTYRILRGRKCDWLDKTSRAPRQVRLPAGTCEGLTSELGDSLKSPQKGPRTDADQREQIELLAGAVKKLPDDVRELLDLRFQEGLTFGQIAIILDVSSGTIKYRKDKAMERLRKLLREKIEENRLSTSGSGHE